MARFTNQQDGNHGTPSNSFDRSGDSVMFMGLCSFVVRGFAPPGQYGRSRLLEAGIKLKFTQAFILQIEG